MLAGSIDNVQASWPKMGLRMASALLRCGANDLGGVLINESISTAAGATAGQLSKPGALRAAAAAAGRTSRQRSTTYGTPPGGVRAPVDDATFSGADFSSYAALTARTDWRVRDAVAKRRRSTRAGARREFSTARRADDRASTVTYSACYTVVPTYQCFNSCSYCTFKAPVSTKRPDWKATETMREDMAAVVDDGVCELLVLAGEVRPASARSRVAQGGGLHWHVHRREESRSPRESDELARSRRYRERREL